VAELARKNVMDKQPESLWLHEYCGKESGMMVVGSQVALRNLAQQLAAATDGSVSNNEPWPKEILSPWTEGPYRDRPDFTLSFAIRGTAPLQKDFPHTRLNPFWEPVWYAVMVCAIVGVVAIMRWAVALGVLIWQSI